jgi:hypothetical protein
MASHLFGYFVPVQFLRFTSDLHRDLRIIFEGSPRHVQPMRLCLGGWVKVVYPPCHVVRRRETKMTLAYKQQSCEKKTRERGRGSRTRTMSMPLLKSTSSRPAFVGVGAPPCHCPLPSWCWNAWVKSDLNVVFFVPGWTLRTKTRQSNAQGEEGVVRVCVWVWG